MQLASLLPVPAIGMAPWRITDPQIARQCRDALEIRGKLGGYYAALAAESSRTAEPLVRHMEYEFPRNGFTDCNDQFMIGSKYLVAPLLGERGPCVSPGASGSGLKASGSRDRW